ncbi:glycosyltransferase [Pseudalkalibacillus berkeleyi]|uniref:Glycosyltransferase n=1 Tax=Pseudalkalibacillus berkeleyi TaxID=1069813 RepID=A0ABS9H564_9BACL|nr:glycosyltransferase [Pseudalkalibacillus berkeleyi]MCF6139038.1 glycosyltransferase [Pseudalkalibacillus berkeleyi]
MKTTLIKVALVIFSVLIISSPYQADAKMNERVQETYTQKEAKLMSDLRKLWIDHTIWTRNYIVSAIASAEDQDAALSRLLQNQKDIGNAIKPYYGEKASKKLAELLTEHIVIAGELIEAAKNNDQANVKKYNEEWYRNADDIAQFLSSANPNWSKKDLKALLDEHLVLTLDEAVARLEKKWEADIEAFDKGEVHIIKFADALSEGIIKQFPKKFE